MFELIDITAWVVANLTQILGTLVMILLPASYLYWRNSIKRAINKKLQVQITRNPASAKRVDWHKNSPLLRFLDLDKAVATTDYPQIQMVSLGEYMASLDANGTVSLQKALISTMEHYGPRVALPLALFAPASWKKESDVVGAFNNSPYAALLISNMLSTLGLISVSTVAQRQNIDAKKYTERAQGRAVAAEVINAARDAATAEQSTQLAVDNTANINNKPINQEKKRKYKALELMVHGTNPNTDGELSSRLPNSFHLVDDFPTATGSTIRELLIESDQTPLPAPDPVLIHPLFPDLASGNGGCKMACSEGQAQVNQVFSIICNKLAANSLLGLGASFYEPKQPFIVRVPTSQTVAGQEESVDSVEDLVQALEKCGHTVTVSIFANTTSFGVGLCVKEQDAETDSTPTKYIQIPLAYPLSTGLYAQDENGDELDVVTLMQHAAVTLKIQGPLLSAQVDWCLSISGMTGWGPNQEIDRVWTRDTAARTWHSEKELSTPSGRLFALRLTTASSAVLNVAASEEQLLFGGYGALGVCIDSVAAIQQCISGRCTLYPLILGGDAKMGLLSCYKSIRELGRKNNRVDSDGISSNNSEKKWKYDVEADALVSALLQLPCDGIVDPTRAAETAQRALSCLPERSVFAGMKECKASLKAAIKSAEAVMAMKK